MVGGCVYSSTCPSTTRSLRRRGHPSRRRVVHKRPPQWSRWPFSFCYRFVRARVSELATALTSASGCSACTWLTTTSFGLTFGTSICRFSRMRFRAMPAYGLWLLSFGCGDGSGPSPPPPPPPPSPHHLSFLGQPTASLADSTISPAITVEVRDSVD